MKLTPTTAEDIPQIQEWVAADPWHKDDLKWSDAAGMLTGNGLLAFCLQDDAGPLVFVRLDADGEMVRIVMQFGPVSEVSKRRLVVGLARIGVPAMIAFARDRGFKGLIFESVNESLIGFGNRLGFKAAGGDDYSLTFEEQINV